ncbi:small integral membrane protein 14-like isoform X2 [Watersipora subatra]|uniref:small integral membrane protein 14-like isoform X2 n=1 Tax=Watersipora subatra TaxID=2589382 RepID=UPI00355B707A
MPARITSVSPAMKASLQISPLLPQGADGANDSSNSMMMIIMFAWLVIAAALFMFRPASMRAQTDPKGGQGQNDRGEGPPSPPTVH